MKDSKLINPAKAIFWILIYSIAAPLAGVGLIWNGITDVFLYIPRILYSLTFFPLFSLSEGNISVLWKILFISVPVLAYACLIINCFFTLKKRVTLFIIPSMVFICADLLLTTFVMLAGRTIGTVLSFVLDTAYIIFLFYLRQNLKNKKHTQSRS